jgi:choline monooxygenase
MRAARRALSLAAADAEALSRARTLPASWYTSPEVFERERRRIFFNEWHCVGAASQVAAPGAFLSDSVAGWPVVVVRQTPKRGQEGAPLALRGFHNVCRHRAGPLVWPGSSGTCETAGLRCRYHGWMYDLDGKLRATPAFGDAADFRKEDYPLFPIAVREWRGLVFVRLRPEAADAPLPAWAAEEGAQGAARAKSFEEAFAGFIEALAPRPLEDYELVKAEDHTLRCNWKTYCENYAEAYHIPHVHPELNRDLGPELKSYRTEVRDGGRSMRHVVPAPPQARSDFEGLWIYAYPNLALNMYGSGFSLERMCPVSPREMQIRYLYFFRRGASQAEVQRGLEGSRVLTAEDLRIAEAVQSNLDAGVYHAGRLSPRHEHSVFFFQKLVREAVEAAP